MDRVQTNPLIRVRWRPEEDRLTPVAVVHGAEVSEYAIRGDDVLSLLEFTMAPRTYQEVRERVDELAGAGVDAASILATFVDREFLIDPDDPRFDGADEWVDKGWREALYFHLQCRDFDPVDDGSEGSVADARRTVAQFADEEGTPPVYPSFEGNDTHPLPDPEPLPEGDLADVLLRRRTTRRFAEEPISAQALSTVLGQAMAPVREVRDHVREADADHPERYLLSAHTVHEIYPVVLRSPDLDAGVYHYDVAEHALDRVEAGEFADEVRTIAIGQGVDGASVVFLVSACFDRYQWRYRYSRALRNLYVETASLAHRLILSATAYGWNNFLTPALRDSRADSLTDTDGYEEAVQYLVAVGQ